MADSKKVTGRKRARRYPLYRGLNQVISTKLTAIDKIQFPTNSGQPVFSITGTSKFDMQTLITNSKFASFGSLFSYYKLTGIAIETIGQGNSNYDFPCAIAVFPSGTGNFVLEWNTVRAANMCTILSPLGRVRNYYRIDSGPYRQVDAVPTDYFTAVVGSEANSTRDQFNLVWSVKIDVYIKFKLVKV